MDENEIKDGLRGICLAEPALGFDPDEVATRAARRLRNRRSTVGASVGTLAAVGVAAGALAIVPHMSSAAGGGGQSSYATATATGTATAGVTPRMLDMTAQMARVRQHLLAILPGLLPGASHLTVTMQQYGDAGDGDTIMAIVEYRDAGGPAAFNLTVIGKLDSSAMGPPGCGTSNSANLPQADGSTVCVMTMVPFTGAPATGAPATGGQYTTEGFEAIAHRPDGSAVSVYDSRLVGAALARRLGSPQMTVRAQPPLDQQQILTLLTDPQLNLDPGR